MRERKKMWGEVKVKYERQGEHPSQFLHMCLVQSSIGQRNPHQLQIFWRLRHNWCRNDFLKLLLNKEEKKKSAPTVCLSPPGFKNVVFNVLIYISVSKSIGPNFNMWRLHLLEEICFFKTYPSALDSPCSLCCSVTSVTAATALRFFLLLLFLISLGGGFFF